LIRDPTRTNRTLVTRWHHKRFFDWSSGAQNFVTLISSQSLLLTVRNRHIKFAESNRKESNRRIESNILILLFTRRYLDSIYDTSNLIHLIINNYCIHTSLKLLCNTFPLAFCYIGSHR
jgi:hypothetical protein